MFGDAGPFPLSRMIHSPGGPLPQSSSRSAQAAEQALTLASLQSDDLGLEFLQRLV